MVVKAAGHFFLRVDLCVGKKMNAPEGLGLDNHYVRGLVGNCLFLYILFLFIKYYLYLVSVGLWVVNN